MSSNDLFKSKKQQNNQNVIKTQIKKDEPTYESPNFENFAEHSSIHGLRFLSKQHNNNFTRIFWSLSLIMSLIGLFYNGKRLFIKLNISPDIGISVKHELAREVPFPAVTFCMPLFAKNGLANYSYYVSEYHKNGKQNLLNLTETDKKFLTSNSLKCAINRLQPLEECCNDTDISDILQLMDKSQLTVEEGLAGCSLRLAITDCNRMFTRILTERGFCFTTNMQNIDTIVKYKMLSKDLQKYMEYPRSNLINKNHTQFHWTLDNGYADSSTKEIVPYRLTKANVHIARTFSNLEDAINVCNFRTILVKIHLPNEIPTLFHGGFQIEQTHEKRFKLRAKATKAHPSLRGYSPSTRLCYFEDEKKLKFFKTYTKHQCYLECLAEDVMEKCGCVAFYMPRNSSTRVCGFKEALCVHRSTYDWPDYEDLESGTTPCDCYPTCNDIEYTVSETNFVYDASIHADRIHNYSEKSKGKLNPNNTEFLKTMDKISNDVYVVKTPLYDRMQK
ncbi:pickpocket protein 28-like [Chironomus tepperi]|uniref:pickpocket protein 28-like n=1 Tax=Chironomus tepperi TaxID=113505 RepID=UPI00391F105B